MKAIKIIFGFIILSILVKGQNNKYLESYHSFLKSQFSDRYIDKGNIKNKIFEYDFSPLWLLPGSTDIDNKGYGFAINRPDLIGFIGDNYQRIYIKFIQITKNPDKPNEYFVYGKSNVKGNICDFIGTFKIKLAREYGLNYNSGEDFLVHIDSVKRQGVIICQYDLYENTRQKYSGKFSGFLTTSFFTDSNNQLNYNAIKGFSDSYKNNQFIGTWTSYKTDSRKTCNFGEWRIPYSGDLDVGTGEFSPNNKYFNNGWNPGTMINKNWWK